MIWDMQPAAWTPSDTVFADPTGYSPALRNYYAQNGILQKQPSATTLTTLGQEPGVGSQVSWALYSVLSTAGVAAGAYHGYKRNNSVGWAIGWALLGGVFPFITIPVSIAQGFGKPKR